MMYKAKGIMHWSGISSDPVLFDKIFYKKSNFAGFWSESHFSGKGFLNTDNRTVTTKYIPDDSII